jgi:hypothetical protein
MRIAGTVLLIGGVLLCVSIVWAALGFLMMGFGLICLLIAERRRARLAASTIPYSDEIDPRQEPALFPEEGRAPSDESTAFRFHEIAPRREPALFPERRIARSAGPAGSASEESVSRQEAPLLPESKSALAVPEEQTDRRQSAIDPCGYDAEKWGSLIRNDADLSRAAATLEPFGKKYVDELASAYLVLDDKDYLPIILRKIAATIRKDSGRDVAGAAAIDSDPNTDLISFALSKTRSLAVEQLLHSRTVHDAVTDEPVLVSKVLQMKPDTKLKRTTAQSALRTFPGQPGDGTSATARGSEAEESNARRASGIAAIAPATKASAPDDTEDLANLLNRIDLDTPSRARR